MSSGFGAGFLAAAIALLCAAAVAFVAVRGSREELLPSRG
jgi:hypothetical protein